MSQPLRVAHFTCCHEIGGGETYALSVMREQLRQGLQVCMIANPGSLLIDAAAREGLAVVETATQTWLGAVRLGQDLADIIAEHSIDIVHSHYHRPYPVWLARGCHWAGVPLVVSLHRPVARMARADRCPPRRGLGLRRRLQYGLVDRYLPVSCASRDQHIAEGLDPARMVVVYNGVDPAPYGRVEKQAARRELGLPADAFVFGTVGRLLHFKRQDLFIKAGARVCAKWPQAHLAIVGDGPLRAGLESLAGHLDLTDRCHFTGFRWDVPTAMAAFDCFVLSSRKESFGMVLAEAMASSLPVVATRVGAVPEVVAEGETGYLASPSAVDGLADAMLRMVEDPAQAAEMGRRGRQRVEANFTLERTVRQLTEVYREAIEERAHSIRPPRMPS